nr:ABC transporter ATP-binding protein [uncultured Anaerostipes sp.]
MIEVKHLTKKYGRHLALDDLSFTVEKGQIYGFLGPNGAGKSTTMNIMTGYISATDGEVLIDGCSILEEPEKAKKCIGYLPEIPPLYLDMTVMEYLNFVAELKKIPKDRRLAEVKKARNLVKLSDVSDRLIRNLSKGYRQRTGLAAAVLGFPDIIILDEPTVGLDPKQIIEIRELIRTLAKDHTVILSSHILAEVQEICDYVLIISKGRLAASGTPEELEKLSQGKESIELTIKANKETIQTILDKISGIQNITWQNETNDACDILIETSDLAQKVCEDISLSFATERIPVTKINILKATLEDIFLELTEGDSKNESNL